jgi:hypothetical protein
MRKTIMLGVLPDLRGLVRHIDRVAAAVVIGCCLQAVGCATGAPVEQWRVDLAEALRGTAAENPIVSRGDPYAKSPLNHEGSDAETVCALRFRDDRSHYELRTFADPASAERAQFRVTHFGRCGICSTLDDLRVYLLRPDLITPVSRCTIRTFVSDRWALDCLEALGFSPACAESWLYNGRNTRRVCFATCLKAWLLGSPNNLPDGRLNPCLACDVEKSGPVFKRVAGRTRRNSGLSSRIERPTPEIRELDHDYFLGCPVRTVAAP